MKNARAPSATWIGGTMLAIVARVDTDVLQWPGGGVIALSLMLYAVIVSSARHIGHTLALWWMVKYRWGLQRSTVARVTTS